MNTDKVVNSKVVNSNVVNSNVVNSKMNDDFKSLVVVIDKNDFTATEICEFLKSAGGNFKVLGVYASLSEARRFCKSEEPDIIIFNLALLSDGCIQTAKYLSRLLPETHIVGFLPQLNNLIITYAMSHKFFRAIYSSYTNIKDFTSILLDQPKIDNPLVSEDVKSYIKKQTKEIQKIEKLFSMLTKKEADVFILLLGGYKNLDLAKILSLSPKTISSHKSRILKKLNINSLSELMEGTSIKSSRKSLIKTLRALKEGKK